MGHGIHAEKVSLECQRGQVLNQALSSDHLGANPSSATDPTSKVNHKLVTLLSGLLPGSVICQVLE
jgi:hypothetical protein